MLVFDNDGHFLHRIEAASATLGAGSWRLSDARILATGALPIERATKPGTVVVQWNKDSVEDAGLVKIDLLCLRTLGADSSYLEVCWPLMVIATGFGLCTAPTTSAIMTAAPNEKQGVASAVNDATREVGGALGIAMGGSILAASYSEQISGALGAFPEPVRGPASDSLAEALAVANQLGPQGQQLEAVSKAAFVTAIDSSFLVMAAIVGAAAVVIPVFAPGRDG